MVLRKSGSEWVYGRVISQQTADYNNALPIVPRTEWLGENGHEDVGEEGERMLPSLYLSRRTGVGTGTGTGYAGGIQKFGVGTFRRGGLSIDTVVDRFLFSYVCCTVYTQKGGGGWLCESTAWYVLTLLIESQHAQE